MRVYHEGQGFVYDDNVEEINKAQKALDDFSTQSQILEIDARIDAWKKEKEMWTSVVNNYEKEQNRLIAEQMLGANFANKILNMKSADLTNFVAHEYKSVSAQIENKNREIESNNEKILSWQNLKNEWSSLADNYKLKQDEMNTALEFGADFEKQVLDGKLKTMQSFAEDYISEMDRLIAKQKELDRLQSSGSGGGSGSGSAGGFDGSSGYPPSSLGVSKVINSESVITQMKSNSSQWAGASESEREKLHDANAKLGEEIGARYDPKSGQWYDKIGIPLYAKGTRNASGGLSIVDEEGYEQKLRPLFNGKYAMLEQGDVVFTKAMTDNLFDWGKMNPEMTLNNIQNGSTSMPIPQFIDKSLQTKFNIGDVHIHNPVGDTNSLSRAIINQLPNKIIQDLFKR